MDREEEEEEPSYGIDIQRPLVIELEEDGNTAEECPHSHLF